MQWQNDGKCQIFYYITKLSMQYLLSEAVVHRCFVKKVFLVSSQIFKEKHLCQSLFFNEVAGLPVDFMKFLRTSFFIEHFWWLFLFSIETVFSFAVMFFSECIFSNGLKHLKRFCCECKHALF